MPRRVTVDLTVLRESRDLRLVVIGEGISGLGTQAALVAIPFQIYVLTHSAALVGLLGVADRVRVVGGGTPPASASAARRATRRLLGGVAGRPARVLGVLRRGPSSRPTAAAATARSR